MATTLPPCAAPRPAVEVADIFRARGDEFASSHLLSLAQLRAMRAIVACRTPMLGGHLAACQRCGALHRTFHSCGNRHCPKCQTLARQRWVEARQAELLEVEQYFHVVFTLPHALNPLAQGNPRVIYHLLFQSAAATLREFAANPRWLGGGELATTMVLHTWGQTLEQHIHVHCIVAGGALSFDRQRWLPAKPGFLFPVRALSRVFRGKYLAALSRAHDALRFAGSTAPLAAPEHFAAFQATLRSHEWVVYAKRPFSGPKQVLAYLGRYTHRVAISNDRLVSFSGDQVRFRYRDYRHGNKIKTMTLRADEFIRRFLLHVLPQGLMRIRHFGVLANRCRATKLAACRAALDQAPPPPPPTESAAEMMLRVTGIDILRCPHCTEGRLIVIASLPPRAPHLPPATGPPSCAIESI